MEPEPAPEFEPEVVEPVLSEPRQPQSFQLIILLVAGIVTLGVLVYLSMMSGPWSPTSSTSQVTPDYPLETKASNTTLADASSSSEAEVIRSGGGEVSRVENEVYFEGRLIEYSTSLEYLTPYAFVTDTRVYSTYSGEPVVLFDDIDRATFAGVPEFSDGTYRPVADGGYSNRLFQDKDFIYCVIGKGVSEAIKIAHPVQVTFTETSYEPGSDPTDLWQNSKTGTYGTILLHEITTDTYYRPPCRPVKKEVVSTDTPLIVVDSPIRHQSVTSPIMLSGEARGYWFFEASAPVVVVDWDGRIIGESYVTAQGDWMTEDFVPFSGTVEYDLPVDSYSASGTVIFRRDNPSGLPENDAAFEVPVLLQ